MPELRITTRKAGRGQARCAGLADLETGHAGVLGETLRRARTAGLRAAQREPHHDVDTVRDFELLRRELLGASPVRAPRTRSWLRAHPAAGRAPGRGDSMRP